MYPQMNSLDLLETYCDRLGLEDNINQTQIIVCRKSAQILAHGK